MIGYDKVWPPDKQRLTEYTSEPACSGQLGKIVTGSWDINCKDPKAETYVSPSRLTATWTWDE